MVICATALKTKGLKRKNVHWWKWGRGRCLGRERPTLGCDTFAGSEYWRSGARFPFACTRPSHSLLGLTKVNTAALDPSAVSPTLGVQSFSVNILSAVLYK